MASDQTPALETTPAAQPPTSPSVVQALHAIKDNFVLVSAAAVLIGVALSTSFLFSYLSVFDWHLIWFVQYADILTFGLLAVSVISGSTTLIYTGAQTVLSGVSPAQRKAGLVILVLLWTAGLALNIWGAVKAGEGFFHHIFAVVTFAVALVLVLSLAAYVEAQRLPTALQTMSMLLLLVAGAGGFGTWLGYSVKETASFNQNVSIKDQSLNDMKIVIVMSRHTVLLKDHALYVIPTADISRFQTVSKNAKP